MPVPSKISTAQTVIADYKSKKGGGEDFLLLELLVKFLLNDVETEVRAAVSEQLRDYSELPKEWALQLALDVETVALPILKSSLVLEDEHLVEILKSSNEKKQIVIAQRDDLSYTVTDCISEIGCLKSVKECLKNQSAEISECGYDQIIIRYKNDKNIHQLIVRRPTLPDRITNRLTQLVSEEVKNMLVKKGTLPEDLMNKMIENAKEKALVNQLKKHKNAHDKKRAVVQLKADGKLTATLMLRSLILGDLIFFTAGLSQVTGIATKRVTSLIMDSRFTGLNRLYERASLPQYLYPAFKIALQEFQNKEIQDLKIDCQENHQTIINKIASLYNYEEDLQIDFLMEKLLPDSM